MNITVDGDLVTTFQKNISNMFVVDSTEFPIVAINVEKVED